jgi:hydroxyacylglutathione hydrolase
MFLRFFDEGLAQASFLIACERTREAAVVDPRRDIDIYASAAKQHGLTIAYAIETHIHADFVSGAREFAAIGARVVAGPGADLQFDHHRARHGEPLPLGDTSVEVLHTPGHTPEHISLVVREPGQPVRLLSGDTLFVGAVGRPDLLGEDQARTLAGQLYRSLFDVMLALPDTVEVHPGHGAGSLCGAGIGNEPHSTIGQERRFNPMLQHRSSEAFIAAVLADLPETPGYFRRMKRVNHQGPPLLNLGAPVPAPALIPPQSLGSALSSGTTLLDVRSSDAFGAGHLAGSVHIAFGAKVGYWAGWVLEPDSHIVVIADDEHHAVEVRRQLLRVGLDRVDGVARGDVERWRAEGLPISSTPQITVRDLLERLAGGSRPAVLDVRTSREWQGGHIEGAVHVPVGEVPARVSELPRGTEVAVICEGGFRSSLAVSLLERAGVGPVVNVTGGMFAYRTLELTR